MADFGIKPEIALGVKSPTPMSLSDMVGTARGLMEYQKLSELYPELIRKTQAETKSAETQSESTAFSLSKSRANEFFGIMGGVLDDPRIKSGNPNAAVQAIIEAKKMAAGKGVPETQLEALSAPFMAAAAHNPQALPNMILNTVQAQIGASEQRGLRTSVRPAYPGMIPGQEPAAPQGGVAPGQPVAAPAAPGMVPSQPPAGVTPADMTAPIQPRFPLRTPGAMLPEATKEEVAASTAGSQLTTSLGAHSRNSTALMDNLRHVIRQASEIEKSATLPEIGVVGAVKRKFAELTGDPKYQMLQKDLANVVRANIEAATGAGNTVAGLDLAKSASGDTSYDPKVLISIARREMGNVLNMNMMHEGLIKQNRQFGEANEPEFTKQWTKNADSRLFQLEAIRREIRDPKEQRELANKILQGTTAKQREELEQKWNNIQSLTNFGYIPQRGR